jgi:hypothetical protein
MLMLTFLHICLGAKERTLCSMAQAIKSMLMMSWVISCICTTLARSLGVVTPVLLPPVYPIMVFLLMRCMETLRGCVEWLLGKLLGHPILECYSWRLILVILEFEIVEIIPLGEWGPDGPHKSFVWKVCNEACDSINIKCTDSCIERVPANICKATNECIS